MAKFGGHAWALVTILACAFGAGLPMSAMAQNVAQNAALTANTSAAPSAQSGFLSAADIAAIDLAFDLTPEQLNTDQDDWAMVERAVRTRPADLGALVTREATPTIFVIYGPVLGPDFTPENHPELAALASRIFADAVAVSGAVKARLGRQRPHARPEFAAAGLELCIPAPASANGAFPSGHALLADVYAAILAEIYPERQSAIFYRAEAFALPRVGCGLHYPSDLLGGSALAVQMLETYAHNEAFQATLQQSFGVRLTAPDADMPDRSTGPAVVERPVE